MHKDKNKRKGQQIFWRQQADGSVLTALAEWRNTLSPCMGDTGEGEGFIGDTWYEADL